MSMRHANLINSSAFLRLTSRGITNVPATLAVTTALLLIATLSVQSLPAQPTSNGHSSAKSSTAHGARYKSKAVGTAATQPLAPPAVPEQPAAPPAPKWPMNDNPAQPAVTWDSHGLRIDAANASLKQILDQVATTTGAKIEGMGKDERVFGEFGPGEARDVLSQLLHGSGYNVLLIGDQGQGTPRQIVLSARRGGETPNVARPQPPAMQDNQDDEVVEQPEPPEEPPTANRPPMPPGPPRTPQQVMQELLQRQQQMNQPMLNPNPQINQPPPPQ